MPKIIGVGAAKTGTTTLEKCFEIFGYDVIAEVDELWNPLVQYGPDYLPILLPYMGKHEGFSDHPWKDVWMVFDQLYDCKFILTHRKDALTCAISSWYNNWQTEPTEKYLRERLQEIIDWETQIVDHFRSRPNDFLTVCWETGDGWKELCEFLDKPIPDDPFPWAYKNPSYDHEAIYDKWKDTFRA